MKKPVSQWSIDNAIVDFIAEFEGLRLTAYDDLQPYKTITHESEVVGTLTIGYGHTHDVYVGQTISEYQAVEYLKQDLQLFKNILVSKINVDLTRNQFTALLSHTFNTGGSENLFKLVNGAGTVLFSGQLFSLFRWWTEKYVTASGSNGVPLAGLITRRLKEYNLFNSDSEQITDSNKISPLIWLLLPLILVAYFLYNLLA